MDLTVTFVQLPLGFVDQTPWYDEVHSHWGIPSRPTLLPMTKRLGGDAPASGGWLTRVALAVR
jgi:hypothetical protein